MSNLLEEQSLAITVFYKRVSTISEELAAEKQSDTSWSIKEVVGHLVDSASNNHQRILRMIAAPVLIFPSYEQGAWVEYNDYQAVVFKDLLNLWYYYNLHLLHLYGNLPDDMLSHLWKKETGTITLEEMRVDYYKHLLHHIEFVYSRL